MSFTDNNLEAQERAIRGNGGQTYVEQKPKRLRLADGHGIKKKRKDNLKWTNKTNAIRTRTS
jgi:hypothetical protein